MWRPNLGPGAHSDDASRHPHLVLQHNPSVKLFTHKWCAHGFEQARGGSGAWYAMELSELLPHVARGLNINWDEATRNAGLVWEVS